MQDVCVCVRVHAYTLPEKYQYNPWLGHLFKQQLYMAERAHLW